MGKVTGLLDSVPSTPSQILPFSSPPHPKYTLGDSCVLVSVWKKYGELGKKLHSEAVRKEKNLKVQILLQKKLFLNSWSFPHVSVSFSSLVE